MTLAKQILDLPIVGGINQKEDSTLTSRPTLMSNCLYRKSGSVSKRCGFNCTGLYNLRSDGTTPPTGEMLCTYNEELLRIGGGCIDSYQVVNATSDWLARGRVPEAIVQVSGAAAAGVAASSYTNPSIAYANGHTITAYATNDGTNYYIFVDVVNVTTGARVYSRKQLATSTSVLASPKAMAYGATAGVFWGDDNGGSCRIRGCFLDLTAMTWGTVASVVTSVATLGVYSFDCDPVDASEWAVVYEASAGANRILVKGVSPTISAGLFVTMHSAVALNSTDTSLTSISLRYSSDRIWVAYVDPTPNIKVGTVTTSFVAETTPFSVNAGGSANAGRMIGIEQVTATTCIVAWTDVNDDTKWNEATSAGVVSYNPPRILKQFCLLTRPLVRSSRAYCMVANVATANATQFLIDMSLAESQPSNGSPRIVAVTLPEQMPSLTAVASWPRFHNVAGWANVASNEYSTVSLVAGPAAQSLAIVSLRAKFDSAWKRTVAQTANLLTIGGGCVSGYDGSQAFEYGFAHAPDTHQISAFTSSNGAGTLTSSLTYSYKLVYAWTDGQGNTHRSAPSGTMSVTLGASDDTVAGTAPCLHLTNKDAAATNTNLSIELYRTFATGGVMGSEFRYVTTIHNVCGSAPIAFTDTASDATVSAAATLYTTGGIVDRVIPAGGNLVLAWKGGIIVAGTDDDSTWLSGEIVAGEGPWFNDTLVIPPFEAGRVAALAQLDGVPVLFKSDATFYVQGEPPTDLGVSSIGSPIRVQTDVGCTDVNSVIATDMGVTFKARTGLYTLNRSLQVVPTGKPVEDSYSANGFVGAVSLPAQGLVRFVQKASTDAALNLDTYHSAQFGTPVWSKDTYSDPKAALAAGHASAYPVGCAMWGGTFVWLSTSGYLYQESSSSFLDVAGATVYWVTLSFEAGADKISSVQAQRRVWYAAAHAYKKTDHAVTMLLTTDAGSESATYTAAQVSALVGLPEMKLRKHVATQKCQWMSVRITDADPTTNRGTGEGLSLKAVSLELGVKRGFGRVAAANRK